MCKTRIVRMGPEAAAKKSREKRFVDQKDEATKTRVLKRQATHKLGSSNGRMQPSPGRPSYASPGRPLALW